MRLTYRSIDNVVKISKSTASEYAKKMIPHTVQLILNKHFQETDTQYGIMVMRIEKLFEKLNELNYTIAINDETYQPLTVVDIKNNGRFMLKIYNAFRSLKDYVPVSIQNIIKYLFGDSDFFQYAFIIAGIISFCAATYTGIVYFKKNKVIDTDASIQFSENVKKLKQGKILRMKKPKIENQEKPGFISSFFGSSSKPQIIPLSSLSSKQRYVFYKYIIYIYFILYNL